MVPKLRPTRIVWLLLWVVPFGCGPKAPVESVPEPPEPSPPPEVGCAVVPGEPNRWRTLRIALTESVEPAHAPAPVNEAEGLVFRQAYETLVRLDCDGHALPGLAATWEASEASRVWTFRLRPEAKFWDGTPVTPQDLRRGWERAAAMDVGPDRGAPWRWVRPESVRVLEDGRVVVRLTRTTGAEPRIFAHAALAVARPSGADPWPAGTGAYRIAKGSTAWDLTLTPNPERPKESGGMCDLMFAAYPGSDPRDFLDRTDLALLRTQTAIEFAARLRSFRTVPLVWSRLTLVFFRDAAEVEATVGDWDELRKELAEHIVDSDARPTSRTDASGADVGSCRMEVPLRPAWTAPESQRTDGFRVVHRGEDADAGRVASRLVGLWPAGSPSPVAVGLAGPAFAGALESGSSWAYVVSLRRAFPEPCFDMAALVDSVGWLRCRAGGCQGDTRSLDLEAAGVPLLRSRDHLAVRNGVTGVRQDWDGTVLLDRAGWAAETAP